MYKMNWIRLFVFSFALYPVGLFAQQSASMPLPKDIFVSSTILSAKQDSQPQNSKEKSLVMIDNKVVPFFGSTCKANCLKFIDKDFLQMCDNNFKSREEASGFFAARAWEYLSEGKKDTATYRFNLSWLLDSLQVDSYWGLGVIAYQNEKYPEAISLMQKGLEIEDDPSNITLMVDLATVYIKCFTLDHEEKDMIHAFELLDKAVNIQPQYANAYMQLALAKLVNGKIDEAWINFHKGYELDPESANAEILDELLSKKEDPEHIFRKQ